MSKVDKLKAELALAEAEEAFLVAKEKFHAGKLKHDEWNTVKAEIRALRQDYRENHRGPKVGAAPDPVSVSVS